MVTWATPPAIKFAFLEANVLWPNRSKLSDGTIGDLAHSSRTSDHNPGARNFIHAFDLTHDPGDGVDCNVLTTHLRNRVLAGFEKRVKYIIWNRRIFNPSVSPNWRTYSGTNPHTKHMHVSILSTVAAEYDVSPWWPVPDLPPPGGTVFNPPLDLVDVVSSLKAPNGGVWVLQKDGAIFAFECEYKGGCNGKPYFVGRQAAKLEASGDGYVIVASSGERYGPVF